ncbi:AAA domain-containing protein [[Mycoplasma] collis]|uniref:AAA domain-containing protein n=1 Tax=[Mycoplasma] collis TaxID=2127 RepID=UPI00068A494F|nr:AAA domain-containing protein [[Mycoplasma] collis]
MQDNFQIKKEKKKKYKKILDNLHKFDKLDTSLKTKINNTSFFDLSKILDEKSIESIYARENFKVSLNNKELDNLLKDLKITKNFDEVVYVFRKRNEALNEKIQEQLVVNFSDTVRNLCSYIEDKINKNNNKWKKFHAQAKSLNAERNIWPMQIGVLFVSCLVDNKEIFAPLFFKEVNIEINNGQAELFSNGDLKINEKLRWFLEKKDYLFDLDFDISQLSLKKLEENLKTIWSNYNIKTFKGALIDANSEILYDSNLNFYSGMVLGNFNSFNNHQRKIMEQIIENDEFDELLEVELDKRIYKNRVNNFLVDDNLNLVKINKTNFSQDKATISALNQNTIIWGPPGTGKSQTISNIMANIIFYNKKALITSQKKAALDILRSRMGELSIFCLFVLNDKTMKKTKFYESIMKLIDKLENFSQTKKPELLKIIYDDEKKHVDLLSKIKTNINFEKDLKTFSFLKNKKSDLSQRTIELLYELSKNIHLNPTKSSKKIKEFKFELLECLKNKKLSKFKKLFYKFSKDINRDANIIFEDFSNYNGLISELTDKIVDIEKEKLLNINDFYNHIFTKNKIDITDEKTIVNYTIYNLFKKIQDFIQNKENKKLYDRFRYAAKNGWRNPYNFISDHYTIIKLLFPIIITSVETELTKWNKNEFDYVILDEASQIFIEKAIPMLYLGKIKVFAGDDKQMQPSSWFSTRSNEEDIELGDTDSILDFAVNKGVYSILLDKNYRSNYASLMTFSSKHFYKSKLDVIDTYKKNKENPIEVYNIDGKWEKSINLKEAELIVELAQKNLNKYPKIILLAFNRAQIDLIENIIFNKYPDLEKAINNEQILLKNIENIQGDEADLLLISVVYDNTTILSSTYVCRRGGENALNVAISRAKSKIIVIKSIEADSVNTINESNDFRTFKNWLSFLELTNSEKLNYLSLESEKNNTLNSYTDIENEFRLNVIEKIESLEIFNINNLKIEKNYIIGSKKIDLAILNSNNLFIMGIVLNHFYSYNNYEEYIIFNDNIKFLKSKKYSIHELSEINWILNEEKNISKIEAKIHKKLNDLIN